MNEHEQIQTLLAVYDDLSEGERATVAQHLAECEACARRFAEYRAMDDLLVAHVARDRAPAGLRVRPAQADRPQPLRPAWRLLRGVASVALLALLVVLLVQMLGPRGIGPQPPTADEATGVVTGRGDASPPVGVASPTAAATATDAAVVPSPTTAATGRALTICTGSEPVGLLPNERSYITQLVREIIQPPLIGVRQYQAVPLLVEALPGEEVGTLQIEPITLAEGDRFYDAIDDRLLTLTAGMTESFGLAQPDGTVQRYTGWQGEPLTTVSVTARWTLVEGLMWEDGQPVTASDLDYAFVLDRELQATGDPLLPSEPTPTTASNPERYRGITQVTVATTALDERTFEWRGLPGYATPPADNLLQPQPLHAYRGIENPAEDERLMYAPLAYGPYRIGKWVPGDSITLLPNPHARGGPPPLGELTVRFLPQGAEMALPALLEGSCDVGVLDLYWDPAMPTLRSFAEQGQVVLSMQPTNVFEHISFNLQPGDGYSGAAATLRAADGSPLFQNLSFRQAVAHCLDRQALIDQALDGAGFTTNNYLSNENALAPAELPALPAFDPAQGQALLASLGWEDRDGDGTREDASGTPLVMRYDTRQNPMRERATTIIADQLQSNCGIRLEVGLHGAEFFAEGEDAMLFGRRFDLAEFAWMTGLQAACDLYTSTTIPSAENAWQGSNLTGFADPAFDAACANPDMQAEAVRIFTEQLPAIPLFRRAVISVARPEVIGFAPDPSATVETWNVAEWDVAEGP